MSTVNVTTVLAAITSFPQSATAIAKKMGLNKGSQIMSYLDDLCDNGSIEVDESGRFPVYTKKVTKKNKNLTVTTTADVVNVAYWTVGDYTYSLTSTSGISTDAVAEFAAAAK